MAAMYKPPHKRSISPSLPAARSADALHPESRAPGGQSQRSTGIASMAVQETVEKYEPPHKRGTLYDTPAQRSRNCPSYSARPKAASRPAAAPRFFSVGTTFSQYIGSHAVGSAAAKPPCNDVRAAPVLASGAVPSSKIIAAQLDCNTYADTSLLDSYNVGAAHRNGTTGQSDLLPAVNTSPSLVELLTSADTGNGLDTAAATTGGSSAVATWANEQLKAQGSASRQHKVDANLPQKANADRQEQAGPKAQMQPKAEIVAAHEAHLELGGSIVQRPMAVSKTQAELRGQFRVGRRAAISMESHAETGPSATASQYTGMPVPTLSRVACITESIHAFKGHTTANTVILAYND